MSPLLGHMQADVENQGKVGKPKIDKSKAIPRAAAGQKWYDATLSEWAENDFRIFVGDMGNEVNDDILTKAFTKYATFQRAKIVRDKHSNKSKGEAKQQWRLVAALTNHSNLLVWVCNGLLCMIDVCLPFNLAPLNKRACLHVYLSMNILLHCCLSAYRSAYIKDFIAL